MNAKVPKFILVGKNECVGVESPTRFVHQEALMNPHNKQKGNLPSRHANPKELWNSNLDPRWCVGVDQMRFVKRWALKNPTSANTSMKHKWF